MKKAKILFIIIIVLTILTFCGCIYKSGVFMNLKTDYSENHMNASYSSFDGEISQKISFEKNDKVSVSFTFSKEKDEKICFEILDINGEALIEKENIFEGSIIMPEKGKYTIKVLGEKTKGDFNLEWEVLK